MKIRYVGHLLKTKGFLGTCSRFVRILNHFGITSKKIECNLKAFITITTSFGFKPTLCITAMLLEKNPKIRKLLNCNKAEVAMHGYVHIDYKALTQENINNHFLKAQKIFNKYNTPLFGFRLPYLSYDEHILKNIYRRDFLWSSNRTICWNVLDKNNIIAKRWENFQRVINSLYIIKNSLHYLSLPKKNRGGVIEIPISIPDDEIIIDRLRINDTRGIYRIWQKIQNECYRRGELFTFQSHHERVPIFHDALKSFLLYVKSLSPKVWNASLREIAEWWKEKNEFTFQLLARKNNHFDIHANCSPRATILVKKSHKKCPATSLFENYKTIDEKNFTITCDKKPFIGIAEHSPIELRNFLHEEGFMTEVGSSKNDYALYLDNYQTFSHDQEIKVLHVIENTPFPLIRFWRWPDKSQSALAITGDIDGITIFDFCKRILHFLTS